LPDSVVTPESVDIERSHAQIVKLVDNIETVIYGKRDVVEMCVVGLLARGHLLIEDIPGIGKTTLAQALALSIDCSFNRVQFTSDMLPADILGISMINPTTHEFEFREGPIFASVVLADEINRTPPKTQSALLEAMSEFHVTADGVTRKLPAPFMVLATQNPIEYDGTYTLPEAQLDRFLLRISIGYPNSEDELRIMRRHDPQPFLDALVPELTGDDVNTLQDISKQVKVEESVARYMLGIVNASREHPGIRLGASPRASLALYESCQAYALVHGRDYVTPGDVKIIAPFVMGHRIIAKSQSGNRIASAHERDILMQEVLDSVTVPA
jgi:MoxR-like ATPase